MKRFFKIAFALSILAVLLIGCYPRTELRIQTEALRLPANSKILVFEARPGILTTQIGKFRESIQIKGLEFVAPPSDISKTTSLNELIKELSAQLSTDLTLVIVPDARIEKRYLPYTVVTGFRNETYRRSRREGVPEYEFRTVPIVETRYRYECSRISYRLYHYDREGKILGSEHIHSRDLRKCPDMTAENIQLDDIKYLLDWLTANISTL